MKLINQKVEVLYQDNGIDGMLKHIELCGRTSYKSEDKITPESYKAFCQRLIDSHHGAVLEFGTVYLKIPYDNRHCDNCNQPIRSPILKRLLENKYTKYCIENHYIYVTTNFRVIIENDLQPFMPYMCEPTEYHEKRYTLKFTTSRGISHELVRSRTMSFIQESQRYCNYSKEKYGEEITFIIPSWFDTFNKTGVYEGEIRDGSNRVIIGDETIKLSSDQDFMEHFMCSRLVEAEKAYFYLIKRGYTPQQAREVLPNATKTEICMCGFASDLRFFFDLRLFGKTGAPHPSMVELTKIAQDELIKANIWDDIMKYPSRFDDNK